MADEKRYACHICNREFMTRRGLNGHIANHDPILKAKRSSSAKAARARLDVKEKHRLANSNPAFIKKKSEIMKEALSKDSFKKKRAETDAKPETHQRRSNAAILAQNNPETSQKRKSSIKAVWAGPYRELKIKQLKEKWAEPEFKGRMSVIFNDPEIHLKKYLTMKKNGTFFKQTKPEKKLFEHLCGLFGEDDIEQQAFIHKWPIDFYVKSLDAYVQMDGVYWHGLDRPLEEIMKLNSYHDKIIIKKMENDKEQIAWFKSNEKKLLRMREDDVLAGNYEMLDAFVNSIKEKDNKL